MLKIKINRPTKLTITSITAESGSSTQPNRKLDRPNWNHVKLCTARHGPVTAVFARVGTNAEIESKSETIIAPIAIVPAKRRCGLGVTVRTAAAISGIAGISQRYATGKFIV